MARKEKRFQKLHSESTGFAGSVEILRDTHTGVCYLWRSNGNAGGLTPLLKPDGTPVVDVSYDAL